MTLYGYTRVSTQDQKTDLQVDALVQYGVDPANIFEDKISGKTVDRPSLNLVLEKLQKGDTLVVYKLDRLGRSLHHLVEVVDELGKKGIDFVAITEKFDTTTAMGKCMFHVSAAFAQFARDILIERVNDGLAAAKVRGVKLGRPQIVDQEKKEQAIQLFNTTRMNVRQIARQTGLAPATVHRITYAVLERPAECVPIKAVRKGKPKVPKLRKSSEPIVPQKPEDSDVTWDDFFTLI